MGSHYLFKTGKFLFKFMSEYLLDSKLYFKLETNKHLLFTATSYKSKSRWCSCANSDPKSYCIIIFNMYTYIVGFLLHRVYALTKHSSTILCTHL